MGSPVSGMRNIASAALSEYQPTKTASAMSARTTSRRSVGSDQRRSIERPEGPTLGPGCALRCGGTHADGGPDSTFAAPVEYFRAPLLRSALYTGGSFGRP